MYSIANSTLKFATNTLFGGSDKKCSDTDLADVITRLDSLPIQGSSSSTSKLRVKTNLKHDLEKASTEAMSIPGQAKASNPASAHISSSSSGITFGMGSSWKSSRRVRSANSESGYGSSFYGSSMKSNLSLLEHKEENAEKQKYLDTLPLISLEEVQKHCYEDDAYMVFYDRVYNVTNFLNQVHTSIRDAQIDL